MTKDSIHNQISLILAKFKVQNENIEKEKGKISQLETDLLRKYCIDLYDLVNQINSDLAEETKKEEKITEPKLIKDELFMSKTIAETEKAIETKEPKTWDPPKFEPVNEKPKTPEIQFEEKEKIEEKPQLIIDELSDKSKKTSLHETLVNTSEKKEMIEKYANSKISRILEVIDISKRFELQHNLFKSDNRAFTDSINNLENAGNLESALRIFESLSTRYHWDPKNNLVKELKSFIYRKY